MEYILHRITFVAIPRNILPADNTGGSWCQIFSTTSARFPIIQTSSWVTYSIKALKCVGMYLITCSCLVVHAKSG